MKTFLLIVTFCNVYHETCDYQVFKNELSHKECLYIKELQEREAPYYLWECIEETKE